MSQANTPAAHALDSRVLPNSPVLPVRHSVSFTAYAEGRTSNLIHPGCITQPLQGLALLTNSGSP